MREAAAARAEWVAIGFCVAVVGWLVGATVGWPLMGDSTLIHYVVFLTAKGMRPYRDIVEMNMPGSYLVERAAMRVFGSGAVGWRVFDFALTAAGIWSCSLVLKARSVAAGIAAGVCLATIHAQDGVMMAGQRDYVVAVCELAATACVLAGSREGGRVWRALLLIGCGVLASIAICIKPPAVFFLIALLVWVLAADGARPRRAALLVAAGALVPVLGCVEYLAANGAVGAFWGALHGVVAYHARLDRKPLGFLVTHAFSPVMPLCGLAFVAWVASRRGLGRGSGSSSETGLGNGLGNGGAAGLRAGRVPATGSRRAGLLLVLGAVAGWLSYLVQGKGFSYQRYPFLAFLLLLASLAVFEAMGGRGAARWLGYASAAVGLGMMLLFTGRAAGYAHADPYRALSSDLERLGGASLTGRVQCMDTAGGCIASLYNERLVQSTGFIYDCYFEDAGNALALSLRARFEEELRRNPPSLFIVTDSVCFGGPRSFAKYASWPAFTGELAREYSLVEERHFASGERYWSRKDLPFAYRIYRRHP